MATFQLPPTKRIVQQPIDAANAASAVAGTTTPVETVVAEKAAAATLSVQPLYVYVSYGLVVVGAVAGSVIDAIVDPKSPLVVPGLAAFAALYAVAQAIERFFEPISDWTGTALGSVAAPTADAAAGDAAAGTEQTKDKSLLKTRRAFAISAALTAASEGDEDTKLAAAESAAKAQAALDQVRKNAGVLLWGAASAVAMIVSAWVGLGLLRSVGVQSPPQWLEIVVTGLAIGGGTKPLHDLISNLQAAKEDKKDPKEMKE